MEIFLDKKPANSTIIEGFPGFGLVGTITTEFLIDHLGAEQIGKILVEENAPVIAVHNGKPVDPIGIFYSKKYNLIILHALTSIKGIEWKLAKIVENLVRDIKAKEVITIEGVGTSNMMGDNPSEDEVYYLSNKQSKFEKIKIPRLQEGVVLGVTGPLLLNKKLNLHSLFVETHSALPDSRAAAKAIEALNRYLNLKIDIKPLLKKAEEFESKIKGIIQQSSKVEQHAKDKELNYLG